MEAFRDVAQIVGGDQPGFAKLFLLPEKNGAEAHLTAARTVLRALDPAGGDETAQPFNPALTAALGAKRGDKDEHGEDHAGATAGISADVTKGLKLPAPRQPHGPQQAGQRPRGAGPLGHRQPRPRLRQENPAPATPPA